MHRTLVLLATLLVVGSSLAQTNLRVFIGGQQRPDVIGPLLEQFNAANPGITASLEVGGATSDVQQQYLNTVLTSAGVITVCARVGSALVRAARRRW